MLRRLELLAVFCSFLFTSLCETRAAVPDLKAGVRLAIGGARTHGQAAPEIADWNGDGLNDVLVGHHSGALFVYLNRGFDRDGLVFERTTIPRQDSFAAGDAPIWAWRFNKANCVCPGPGRICPRVVDWNDDGKNDLVIGDGRGAQTRVWKNVGTKAKPVFSTHHLQYLPPDAGVRPYHETVQPCIADWNADGKKDLIMGRNRGVYVYLNEGSNAEPRFDFDRSRLGMKINDVFPTERLSPVVVDWDGDGLQDLLAGTQSGEVFFARNTGSKETPEFDAVSSVKAGGKKVDAGSEARIAVGDVDGDGRTDLLVGAATGIVRFYQARQPRVLARNRHLSVKRGGAISIELIGTDDAGRELTYELNSQPAHGKLTGSVPKLAYTPDSNFTGQDQLTFVVTAEGQKPSRPATVLIDVRPADSAPTIATMPADQLVAPGQPVRLEVAASGTTPFSYQWKKNGVAIPKATGPVFALREAKSDDSGEFSVTVKNAVGEVTSDAVRLDVKPLPGPQDDVPVVSLKFETAVVEPKTAGVFVLTRTGKLDTAVSVKLTSRRGHNPIIADLHYVPLPDSIELKAGETSRKISVTPLNDTLVTGPESLTFQIVSNPAYSIAAGAIRMPFLDDDCPAVRLSVATGEPGENGERAFVLTAEPPPARDTEVSYLIGGTAEPGVDYEPLAGQATIRAGTTSAQIIVRPYLNVGPVKATGKPPRSVELTLPAQPFTFFDFYGYLTPGNRTVSMKLSPTLKSPKTPKTPPAPKDSLSPEERSAVEKLRREVRSRGWIIFTALSGGPASDLDLFVMRPDGSNLQNITRTPDLDEHSARFSPDGRKLLYRRLPKATRARTAVNRLPQDVGNIALKTWPQMGSLVISDSDGANPKVVSQGTDGAGATWGPQGRQLACLEPVPQQSSQSKTQPSQIVIRDAATLKVLRTVPSAGILRNAVWSPDGKRILGEANVPPGKSRHGKGIEYPLGIGRTVSVDIETGRRTSMARFPDWTSVWATDSTADWIRGNSPEILHSANNYGICPAYFSMLWRSGLDGEPSQLVYGEFKKHIWGGCSSPDGHHAIFVIGGETWPLAGRMAIIRLADAPIARGHSPLFHEVLADHFPNLKRGPVLDLKGVPEGFEPDWTGAEILE